MNSDPRTHLPSLLPMLPMLPMLAQIVAAGLWLPVLLDGGAVPRAPALAGSSGAVLVACAIVWILALLADALAWRMLAAGPRVDQRARWQRVHAAGALAQALAWGAGAALLMPQQPIAQLATMAIVVALFAGPRGDRARQTALRAARIAFASLPPALALLAQGSATPALIAAGGIALALLFGALGARTRDADLSPSYMNGVSQTVAAGERVALLERSLARQEREAAEARAQARSAIDAAERASRDKTRFLAAASHDLRQPVHAIGLFVGALKEEIRSGRARYLIDRLDRSMSGLDELFNRLLDISRLDAGAIEARPSVFAITPVLQTLETRFGALAEQRALKFRVRPRAGVNVRTDAALLVEMLMNLLSNAFRYTERGGILLATRVRGDRLVVQVWDTGPGIAQRDIATIFDEFVQLGTSTRDRRHGLGLGLAIVRRLGEALECPVSVRSRPGRGTVFDVAVPISREAASHAAGATRDPAADAALQGMLALVVDDELDILVGMEAILAAWGCYVLVARSVDEAERHIDEALRFPDVLITDHRLGNGDTSDDVVAMIERCVPVPVPVILVSGEVGTTLEAQVRERGWPMLSKPVNPDRLRSLLVELVRAPQR